ncbi:MAG: tellurite resistance TerB family protein [Anderseniella sp.]|jgi:uncharacterized membrane protein YebE (DUF533 family)|nr:tellurite resistance TerB family protein [Anderseniella sp.]
MIDPQKLIEQFLGGGASGSGGQAGQVREKGASPLDAIPGSLKGFGGGVATGGLAAVLLGTKGGRKMAKSAVKLGGLAVLGGLAYKAYNDWQATKGGNSTVSQGEAADAAANLKNITPKAEGTPFLPAPQAQRNALGIKLLQAMIAAAKADGHIDGEEQKRIFAKLDEAGLDAEEKGFLMDELRKPLDIDAIVSLAGNTEEAVEIYAASCLAIDPDDPAEQAYLSMLAARLKLAPELKAGIEREVTAVSA